MQLAGVQYVLDTVTQALALNQDRTFIYGEIVSPVTDPLLHALCQARVQADHHWPKRQSMLAMLGATL